MKKNARSSRKSVSAAVLAAAGVASIVMGIVTVVLEEHGISAGRLAQVAGKCGAAQASDTFIKTFRMRDRADGYGLLPLKDGGYLLTGDTTYSSGMGVWNMFVVKTDAKGVALWSRQFGSMSAAQGVQADTKRLSAETTDGNFVVAADIIDFYDAAYEDRKELWGDVLVTKLNTSGTMVWSTLVGDYSMDFPQRMWATSDGGVLLLAKLKETGYGHDIGDFDAVPGFSVLVKFDAKGKVQWSRKMDWVATDMQMLPDGGFVAVADLDPGTLAAMGKLPTIIRLDSKANVLWAKSIETVSMGIPSVSGTGPADLKIGTTQLRLSGGDFRAVERTPDGGFIAFGRFFNATNIITRKAGAIQNLIESVPYVAVKVNAQGKYLWARSIRTGFSATGIDIKVTKTADNGFVLSRAVMRKTSAGKLQDMVGNVEVTKVDADADPKWVRKIDIERDTAGYDVRATRDGGVALAGRIVTDEEHMVMGEMVPYEDTFLVKTDANGNVSGAKVITDGSQATVEDVGSTLIMQDMDARSSDVKLPINKSVKEKVSAIDDLQRTIVPYAKTTVKPACASLAGGGGAKALSGGEPKAKGWPQISFDNAVEAKIETEKSRTIHAELLPILKKVYADQVKMIDNTSGLWLTYSFPRQATEADREAVQKAYEKLGYKVSEAEGGHLTVSKVGLSLRMTFSINNAMVGKLEVMW